MKFTSITILTALLCSRFAVAAESIKVDVTGVLKTGIVAIGGESTGTTISAKGVTWELEFPAQKKKLDLESLNGETVRVRGELEKRAGVEIKERWVVTVAHCELAKSEGEEMKISTKRKTDQVKAVSSDDGVVVEIESKTGIGSATLTRTRKWPKSVKLRARLSGMESFTVECGDVTVEWSVSSVGKRQARVSVRKRGSKEEVPAEKGSRYFSEVKRVGDHYEFAVPSALLDSDAKELKLNWIDFYR